MKLTRKHKAYIKDNCLKLTPLEISTSINTPVADINDYISSYLTLNPTSKENNSVKLKNVKEIGSFLYNNRSFVLILVILSLIVYFNALWAGFITGDDYNGYVENLNIRNFSTAFSSLNINPIYYSIIYSLFKINPFPLHLFSLFIHILVVILVYLVLSMLFGTRVSVLGTVLFAVHPVNTESVTWISGNVYLFLAASFYVTLIFFLLYKYSLKNIYFVFSVIIFSLSLIFLQSPWVLTFPLMIIVIEFFFLEKYCSFRKIWKYILYALPAVIYALTYLRERALERVISVQTPGAGGGVLDVSYFNKVTYTIFMMLKLYVFPKDLTIYHDGELFWPDALIVMAAVSIVFVVLIIFFFKKNRKISGLLILLPLSILLAFSPITIAWFIAERYLYIGAAFFCALIAFFLLYLEDKYKASQVITLITLFIVILYSAKTVFRNSDWQNSLNLWLATSKISVNSARVYNNLGDAYGSAGNPEMSLASFKRAIEIDPNYADALHNLGNTYFQKNEFESAFPLLEKSVSINPRLYQSYYKMGVISYYRQNKEKAKEYFAKTLELNPSYADTRQILESIKQ